MEADLLQIMEAAIKAMDLSFNLVMAQASHHIPSQLLQDTVEVATAPVPLFSPDTVHHRHTPNHLGDMVRRLLKVMATNNRVVMVVDSLHTLAQPPVVVVMVRRMDPFRVSKATAVAARAMAADQAMVGAVIKATVVDNKAMAEDPVIAHHRDQATEVAVIKVMVVASKVTAEV